MGLSQRDDSVRIDLEDEGDRWRYICPAGHRSWEPTNNHFWCQACASASSWQDVDPEFEELVDRKEGKSLKREDVHLVTPRGEYRDLYKSGGHA